MMPRKSHACRRAMAGGIGLVLVTMPGTMPAAHAQLSLHTGINGMRVFTSSGTWVAPGLLANDRVGHVLVMLVGAGGSGARPGEGSIGLEPSGGGGGCVLSTVPVRPGFIYEIIVGAGGQSGPDGGTPGGTTMFRMRGGPALAQAAGGHRSLRDPNDPIDPIDPERPGAGGTAHADGGIVRAAEGSVIHPLCAAHAPQEVGSGGGTIAGFPVPAGPGWALVIW